VLRPDPVVRLVLRDSKRPVSAVRHEHADQVPGSERSSPPGRRIAAAARCAAPFSPSAVSSTGYVGRARSAARLFRFESLDELGHHFRRASTFGTRRARRPSELSPDRVGDEVDLVRDDLGTPSRRARASPFALRQRGARARVTSRDSRLPVSSAIHLGRRRGIRPIARRTCSTVPKTGRAAGLRGRSEGDRRAADDRCYGMRSRPMSHPAHRPACRRRARARTRRDRGASYASYAIGHASGRCGHTAG
jgi:hypothetical protein